MDVIEMQAWLSHDTGASGCPEHLRRDPQRPTVLLPPSSSFPASPTTLLRLAQGLCSAYSPPFLCVLSSCCSPHVAARPTRSQERSPNGIMDTRSPFVSSTSLAPLFKVSVMALEEAGNYTSQNSFSCTIPSWKCQREALVQQLADGGKEEIIIKSKYGSRAFYENLAAKLTCVVCVKYMSNFENFVPQKCKLSQ